METKPKTYKEEILPLWGREIKFWFGWTDMLNAIWKTGTQLGGLWFALSLTGNLEDFIGSLAVEVGKLLLVVVFTIWVAFITYIRASNKLYDSQVQKRRELGEIAQG